VFLKKLLYYTNALTSPGRGMPRPYKKRRHCFIVH
jgi:hypothetical protein